MSASRASDRLLPDIVLGMKDAEPPHIEGRASTDTPPSLEDEGDWVLEQVQRTLKASERTATALERIADFLDRIQIPAWLTKKK